MERSSPKLKKLSKGGNFQSLKIKNFYISFHIFCLFRENFSNIRAKEKKFLYFPLQRSIIFQIKFLIIIIKQFFLFYNTFFYTQPVYIFHLLRDFYSVYNHIVAFFFFFRKILISLTSFFSSLSSFS